MKTNHFGPCTATLVAAGMLCLGMPASAQDRHALGRPKSSRIGASRHQSGPTRKSSEYDPGRRASGHGVSHRQHADSAICAP